MNSGREFKPLMTKQDLAFRFQVCPRTIEIWVHRGWLPRPMYLHPRAPRWDPVKIKGWERRKASSLRVASMS